MFVVDYFGGPAGFDLAPDGRGGTDLLLTHEGVTVDEWSEVHAGWPSADSTRAVRPPILTVKSADVRSVTGCS